MAIANGSHICFEDCSLIVPAQPDIFTDSNDAEAGEQARLMQSTGTGEPFSVTTVPTRGGTTVPTVIRIECDGLRFATRGEITVTVGTTAITGDGIVSYPTESGHARFRYASTSHYPHPSQARATCRYRLLLHDGTTFSAVSRPAATAPRITIN